MRMTTAIPIVLPEVEEVTATRRVPPYHVILLNDDHHSVEFVIEVLIKALGFSAERAYEHMMEAHTSGRAVVWTAPKEIAELKAEQMQTFTETRNGGKVQLGPLGVEVEPAPE
jgi:ATP-dependent Clp protease adaptor protein ClpS